MFMPLCGPQAKAEQRQICARLHQSYMSGRVCLAGCAIQTRMPWHVHAAVCATGRRVVKV